MGGQGERVYGLGSWKKTQMFGSPMGWSCCRSSSGAGGRHVDFPGKTAGRCFPSCLGGVPAYPSPIYNNYF